MNFGKKFIMLFISLITIFVLSGCRQAESDSGSVADVLVTEFERQVDKGNNAEEIAKGISKNDIIKIAVETSKVEDYMPGFKADILNYSVAYTIRPLIGSIPFIAYVFESDNPEELEKSLKENADLRWNICTEADEIRTSRDAKYVFIVMSPKTFEE